MNNFSWRALAVVGLILIGVFFAGCSDSAAPADAAPDAGVAAATTSGPLYGAGDLVKNPQSTSGTALLILRYDSGTDKYERAYVYPNSDGSLGYRLDAKTDTIDRPVIEKVYTEKIRTVEISSIPIGSPGAATTTAASGTTSVTTVTTTATAVTTTTAYAPKIKGVEPGTGRTGTTVSITELEGQNFLSGANVSLKKSGESPIQATNVVVTSTLITCDFVIPSDTALGYWAVVVTNPDKQSDEYLNAINILQGTTTTTTTTTTSAPATGLVTISSVLTPKIVTGGSEALHQPVQILGTNLSSVSKMKLTRGSTVLTSTFYHMASGSTAEAFFDIPAGVTDGLYAVSVVDDSNTVLASKTDAVNICSNC